MFLGIDIFYEIDTMLTGSPHWLNGC